MATAVSSVPLGEKAANYVTKNRKMLINGKWVEAASGKTFPTYNPSTGEVLARLRRAIAKTSTAPSKPHAPPSKPGRGPG